MRGFLSDCRHALRIYSRTPVASLIAVTVLAVGLAFVSAFASLYVDLVLRPHPGFVQGGRIVTVGFSDGTRSLGLADELIDRIAGEAASLEAVAGVSVRYSRIGREGEPALTEWVTTGFFDGIRPRVLLGRGLAPADHAVQAEPVTVISYRYWQERLGGSAGLLGTMLDLTQQNVLVENGRPVTVDVTVPFRIVGIMAPELEGIWSDEVALWVPTENAAAHFFGEESGYVYMRTLGRRSPGASAAAVARELNERFPEARQEFDVQPGFRLDASDGVVQDIAVQRDARRQLRLFLAGSVLLALAAAILVVGLAAFGFYGMQRFLVAAGRREYAVHAALGAGPAALGRLVIGRGLRLSLPGLVIGVLSAFIVVTWLNAEFLSEQVSPAAVTAGVVAGLTLLLFLAGLGPALQARRTQPAPLLRED